jgi:hypothetical protein
MSNGTEEEPPPLPPLPPEFPPEVSNTDYSDVFKLFWRTLFFDDPTGKQVKEKLAPVVSEIATFILSVVIALQGKVGQYVGKAIVTAEERGDEYLQKAAAFGLSDFFGVPVSPGEVGGREDGGARNDLGQRLGVMLMESMFGSFQGQQDILPVQGLENAERLLGLNLTLALKGWLLGTLGLGYLEHYFPSWGNLKDIVSQSLGLGRVARRAMAPLLNALIVEPLTRDLNSRFRPKQLTVAEAVRALNRGEISDDEYFDVAGEAGYTRARAAFLKVVHSTLPGVSEAAAFFQLGIFDDAALTNHFKALGFHPDFIEPLVHYVQQQRNLTYKNETEKIVQGMVAAREMDDVEGANLLRSIGRTPAEVETLLGNARLLRSKPKRLTEADAQLAYEEGFMSLSDLSRFHQLEGYAPDDAIILEQLAQHKKQLADEKKAAAGAVGAAAKPKKLSESLVVAGFVDGMLSLAVLDKTLADLGYSAEGRAVIRDLAVKRKAAADLKAAKAAAGPPAKPARGLLAGTLSELFVRGIIDEGRLRSYLLADRYSPADADALVVLSIQKRDDNTRKRKAGQTVIERELAQGTLLTAFSEDFITLAELDAAFTDLHYKAEDIAVLEQLAQHKRDLVVARDAKAAGAATGPGAGGAAGAPAPTRKRKATKPLAVTPDAAPPLA